MTRRLPTAARTAPAALIERVEDRRLLSAALTVSAGLMVFNAVNGNAGSQTETLTLTDTGDAALTLGPSAFALGGVNAAQFSLVNAASAPASLAPGSSFGLQLKYTANTVGRQLGAVNISTNDGANPVQTVTLSGIGTAGRGGTNQPSLARILRAYQIPTIVGEGPNDSNEATDAVMPNPPDPSSQEVPLQRFQKAGAGPVTVNVLASFTADAAEPYTLGYYTAGTPADKHELFYTPTSEAQSTYVQPQGSTSFDPGGGTFGMYFVSNIKDNGLNRVGYSEDPLNTFDTTVNRKFRFYPMETPAGAVVPNTYVMATTEYNAPVGYDFTNIVAVVHNVTAAPASPAAAPALSVVNPYAIPSSNTVMFTNIRFQNSTLGDTQHNSNTLTLTNTGLASLTVNSLALSNTTSFTMTASQALPATLASGASMTVTVRYFDHNTPSNSYNTTADPSQPGGGGFETATLSIGTNDPASPTRVLPLTAYTQYHSEDQEEPSLQTIVNLLAGYGTLINPTPISELTESLASSGSSPTYYGEETVSGYWQAADSARPVTVQQLAAYHTQGDADQLQYNPVGTGTYTQVLNQAADDAQTIFPLNGSGKWATGSFTTATTFQFKTAPTNGASVNTEYSDDTKNSLQTAGGHHWRFFPVRDGVGNLLPNTYLGLMDYSSAQANYDFQDNLYLINNVHPAAGGTAPQTGVAPAAPTDTAAVYTAAGVAVSWAPSLTAGAAGYNVYRQNANGSFSLLTTTPTTGTTYTDAAADLTVPHLYRVTTVNAGATQESVGTSAQYTTALPATLTHGGVSGLAFDDSNGNGVRDAGEAGMAGLTVFIDQAGTGSYVAGVDPVTSTDANGNWSIAGLNPGTYTVIQQPPAGYNRTLPGSSRYTVTVTAGNTVAGVNFGADQGGFIVGTAFLDYNGNATLDADEPGLQGITVFIDNNRNGTYDAGIDTQFTTDASGYFTTTALPPGTYVLGQTLPDGFGRSTPGLPATITVTERGNTRVNFGMTRGSIYGTVFADANHNASLDAGETGVAGVQVFLDYFGTGVYQDGDFATTTDANGNYRFVGMAPGVYTVAVTVPPAKTATTATTITDGFYPGRIKLGDNFGLA